MRFRLETKKGGFPEPLERHQILPEWAWSGRHDFQRSVKKGHVLELTTYGDSSRGVYVGDSLRALLGNVSAA